MVAVICIYQDETPLDTTALGILVSLCHLKRLWNLLYCWTFYICTISHLNTLYMYY